LVWFSLFLFDLIRCCKPKTGEEQAPQEKKKANYNVKQSYMLSFNGVSPKHKWLAIRAKPAKSEACSKL
jgi:hypothetical protein